MEETGILENPALLSLVLPDFEPGQIFSWPKLTSDWSLTPLWRRTRAPVLADPASDERRSRLSTRTPSGKDTTMADKRSMALLCLLFFAFAIESRADILSAHYGTTDPTTENFSYSTFNGPAGYVGQATDQGRPTWEITSGSPSSQIYYTSPGLSSAQPDGDCNPGIHRDSGSPRREQRCRPGLRSISGPYWMDERRSGLHSLGHRPGDQQQRGYSRQPAHDSRLWFATRRGRRHGPHVYALRRGVSHVPALLQSHHQLGQPLHRRDSGPARLHR